MLPILQDETRCCHNFLTKIDSKYLFGHFSIPYTFKVEFAGNKDKFIYCVKYTRLCIMQK